LCNIQAQVARPVDSTHAALTEQFQNLVFAVNCCICNVEERRGGKESVKLTQFTCIGGNLEGARLRQITYAFIDHRWRLHSLESIITRRF
jgi:hypothetical protein